MRQKDYINERELRKAVSILCDQDQVFEVRVLGTSKKEVLSGYFSDTESLISAFDSVSLRDKNIYITLGQLKKECGARKQRNRFISNPTTTSDDDIVSYRWLFIDLDPVRMADISSSDEELSKAKDLAAKVYEYLHDLGFEDPVKALSGNGCHLLYRIDIKNDESGRSLVERCLKVLSSLFDTSDVKIDTTNYNPSRICKLHGTLAQKGASTPDRPHRMSRIFSGEPGTKITEREILETLADQLPEQSKDEAPQRKKDNHNQSEEFDLIGFMSRHGLTYEEDSNDRAKIYKLDACPFNPAHKNGDSKIFHYHDGAIAFKCHHNSCRGYRWQDVRLKYEPDAYDKKDDTEENAARIDAGYKKHIQAKAEEEKKKQADEGKKQRKVRKLKSAESLMEKDLPEPKVFIGVGDELPILVEGTNILSAKPKLGKSWLALGMCVAVANGDDFLGYKTRKCSTLYLDLETSEILQQKRLRKVLNGAPTPKNFYLETETDSLENGFVEQIEAYLKEDPDIGIVVIDVFQIIRSPSKSIKETEYEHAYRDITPLNELAQKHHISIILVCHDRKAVDPEDPFSNILGSTGLQGAATQMMVMFRKRKDDPIHISVKGKTIDGLPELNVRLDKGQWIIVSGVDDAQREEAEMARKYRESNIRLAVLEIARRNDVWKGQCTELKNDATRYGIAVTESAKLVGGFLHKHQGRFLQEDQVQVTIINNGTGPKIYKIEKSTIDTIDENNESTIDGFEKASIYGGLEIPF